MVAKCAFNSFLAKQKRSQQSELNWNHWAPKTEFLDLALGRQTDRQTYRHTHTCMYASRHANMHTRICGRLHACVLTVHAQCTYSARHSARRSARAENGVNSTSCVEIASNQFKGYLEACFFCVLIRRGHFVCKSPVHCCRALYVHCQNTQVRPAAAGRIQDFAEARKGRKRNRKNAKLQLAHVSLCVYELALSQTGCKESRKYFYIDVS